MAGDLTVRQYEPSDAERVWAVYKLALKAHNWTFIDEFPSNRAVTDSVLGITENYLEDGGDFLVGLSEDEIIATGGFKPEDETTAEIRKMAVHPDHQRRGYGRCMLMELEDRAERRGFRRTILETFERLRAARRLYESYGYEEIRRELDSEFGEDRIYYQKDL